MKRIRIWILFLLPVLHASSQTKKQAGFHYTAVDSIVTGISTKYKAGFLRRIMMGKNYRQTWNAPVKLPVFYVSKSGLQAVELGGGEQTKSLRLKDKTGKEWVLRTVDKDVRAGLSKWLQRTFVKSIMQDMISASFPYGQIVVAQLTNALPIIAAHPKIYFVADDQALGSFRSIFANTVCVLEERAPVPGNAAVRGTEDLRKELAEGNDPLVLQEKYLQARLLDMLVGDWDRHEGQWQWAAIDSADMPYYLAIPKDRDAAFYYSKGPFMKLLQVTLMPYISGFKTKSTGLRKLSLKALELDQQFLNALDAATWQNAIRQFQRAVNDSVIEASVKVMPPAIYALNGRQLISKLKSRRDGLLKNGMNYYQALSATVTVNGSDQEELFVASGREGKLLLEVFRMQNGKTQQKIYERTFDPAETNTIRLNGLKGDDHFVIGGSVVPALKLKIFGNEGRDIYDVNGAVKAEISDSKDENNIVKNNSSAKICFR